MPYFFIPLLNKKITHSSMKQFKLLSMLLTILMVPMMVSCGGDDEKDNTPSGDDLIIKASGTWMCTQSVDAQNGKSYQGLMVGKEITINPNGTYTSTAPTFGYSGTYTVSGNKITARSDAGDTFLINVSISGDRMTWDGTANNGVSFRYIFERESNVVPSEKAFTKEIIAGDSKQSSSMKTALVRVSTLWKMHGVLTTVE